MAVKAYAYNSKIKLTPHFSTHEFKCKCGKSHNTIISEELVAMLEKLHTTMKCSKAIISSGYRCSTHDKNVGGTGKGQHTRGCAVDICFYDKNNKPISTKVVACVAQELGFKGIANITSKYTHIHLDMGNRIYKGDEVVSFNTVTTDFYKYYKLTKAKVESIIGNKIPTAVAAKPINKKDVSIANFKWSNKYNSQVKALQKILNTKGAKLATDGIAGPKTYNELKKYTIVKGDRGPLTRWVQERLTTLKYKPGIADGICGINTVNAIKAFQKANNLAQGDLMGIDWAYLIK